MDEDISYEDEDTYRGGPLPKPGQVWALAASTYDGVPQWEKDSKNIGKAMDALLMFQELPRCQPDWESLLQGFSRLHVHADTTTGRPPLQDFGDFLRVGDYFLSFASQNEWGVRRLLDILEDPRDLTDPLLADFEELAKRLRKYPPLKSYVRCM